MFNLRKNPTALAVGVCQNDIDVCNVDTGEIAEHITYDNFRQGKAEEVSLISHMRRMKNGLIATIIGQPDSEHVDIIFQHGVIIRNVPLKDYMNGAPDFKGLYNPRLRYDRVGEKRLANSGKWMMVAAYRGTHHIDILFEDGFFVKDKDYRNFKTGEIQSSVGRKKRKNRTGEKVISR